MSRPRYALITGASRGLGKYFARALAERERNLVLVARSAEKLDALAGELRSKHAIQIETLPIDLANHDSAERLAEELERRGLKIDLLVNNAGFGDQGRFHELPLKRQMEMINLQNATVVNLTHRLLAQMIEDQTGGVINVSSMAGFQPVPFAAIYSAAKSFLTTFSLALEAEVRRYGISVVTLCPGRLRQDPEDVGNTERKKVPGKEQFHEEVVVEALHALDRGGGLVIPGGMNKFAAFAVGLVPRSKIARLAKKFSKPQG
jgi:short-subunit dehydrogenase